VVTIGENGITEDDILTHNSHDDNLGLQMMLAEMEGPDFPVALGVIRDVEGKTYEEEVAKQCEQVKAKSRIHSMEELLVSGPTWKAE